MDNSILLGCLAGFFVILAFMGLLREDFIKKELLIVSIFLVFIFSMLLGYETGGINNTGKFLYEDSLEPCTIYEVKAIMPVNGVYDKQPLYAALIRKEKDAMKERYFYEYRNDHSLDIEFPNSRMYVFNHRKPPARFMTSTESETLGALNIFPYPPEEIIDKIFFEECLKK